MLTGLASYGEPAGMIRARAQSALPCLTDRHVFILDTLAHGNTRPITLTRLFAHHIRKVKVEDHFRLVHTTRYDEICIHHTVVPVDHEVWINPVIKRAIAFPNCARLCFNSISHDRAPLQTVMLAVLDQVLAVIQHTVESLVQIRHVITTVEIVIDKHFPIAVEVIMTALKPMQISQLQRAYLRDQLIAKKLLQRLRHILNRFNKDPVFPLRNLEGHETVLRAIEIADTRKIGCAFQFTSERVGPTALRTTTR